MSNLKYRMLAGGCVLATGIAGFSTTASAATQAWGGGSSLISVYMVQAFNCYGKTEPLIVRSPLTLQTVTPFNYVGTKGTPQDCSTQHVNTKVELHYDSAGSGIGIAGVLSHDPSSAVPGGKGYGDIDPNTAGEQDMPYITFGMSDAGLSSSDNSVWNLGNDNNGPANACSVPLQSVCVVAPGETAHPPTTYPNPLETRGAMVQFPISVDPVAFSYDSTYKKITSGDGSTTTSYHFNVQHPHGDGSGGLRMDQTTYCMIYNGQITNWNDSHLQTLNGGQSLQDPTDPDGASWWTTTGVPLQIVGRSDSSGTTSIFTRHLAHVCGSLGINLAGNQYADGATTLPASLQGGNYDGTTVTGEVLGKFTLANGNNLVAKYVAFLAVPAAGQTLTQGHLGYNGVDFLAPYNIVNGQNTYNLNSADLKNQSGKWVAANGSSALAAFGSLSPPQSDSKGHYDLSSCGGPSSRCRAHPYDWAEPQSKTSPLAAPTAKGAFPVVGTTNVIAYTCYSSSKVASLMKKFFTWYVKNETVQEIPDGLLTKNGLASLPVSWRNAVTETFLNNNSGLNLTIDKSGSGVCTGVTGG